MFHQLSCRLRPKSIRNSTIQVPYHSCHHNTHTPHSAHHSSAISLGWFPFALSSKVIAVKSCLHSTILCLGAAGNSAKRRCCLSCNQSPTYRTGQDCLKSVVHTLKPSQCQPFAVGLDTLWFARTSAGTNSRFPCAHCVGSGSLLQWIGVLIAPDSHLHTHHRHNKEVFDIKLQSWEN